MTRLLRRLLGRDDPPTLVQQMRQLWRSSSMPRIIYDKPDGRERMHNPRLKPRTLAEWTRQHGKRSA